MAGLEAELVVVGVVTAFDTGFVVVVDAAGFGVVAAVAGLDVELVLGVVVLVALVVVALAEGGEDFVVDVVLVVFGFMVEV